VKAIVFGGSGFLGSFVSDQLSEQGNDVTIYDVKESVFLKPNQKMIIGNILDGGRVHDICAHADVIYNFAGVSDINQANYRPQETLHTNFVGNLNILEACRIHRVRRYMFASTLYVYSKAGSFYRSSKQACELSIEAYAERYELGYTVLRYGSLYGPRANKTNWIYRVISQALDEKKIVREGGGEEIREYIHVLDAARLSVKALQPEFQNECVIVSGNQTIRIKDLMVMIREMFNNKIALDFVASDDLTHYEITPYTFKPTLAKRIEDSQYIDLGQGMLDLIYTIANEKRKLEKNDIQLPKTFS